MRKKKGENHSDPIYTNPIKNLPNINLTRDLVGSKSMFMCVSVILRGKHKKQNPQEIAGQFREILFMCFILRWFCRSQWIWSWETSGSIARINFRFHKPPKVMAGFLCRAGIQTTPNFRKFPCFSHNNFSQLWIPISQFWYHSAPDI